MCHICLRHDILTGVFICIFNFGHPMCFLFGVCNRVDVILSGRYLALTAGDLTRFQLFVRWSFCLSPQVLSARNVSVADSYCNVFGFCLFCACLFVRL